MRAFPSLGPGHLDFNGVRASALAAADLAALLDFGLASTLAAAEAALLPVCRVVLAMFTSPQNRVRRGRSLRRR